MTRTFYEQQASNRRKTVLLITCFLVLFAAVGLGMDWYWFGFNPFDLSRAPVGFPIATVFALLVGSGMAAQSYFLGDRQVLSSTHSRPADARIPEEKQLLNVVEEMSIAAGINPPPPVYVLPDSDPNAFAVGRDPRHASVAVTAGLLQSLNREELQGVIAHELGHVRNLDIRTMTVVAALFGGLVLLSDFAQRSMRFGFGGRGSRGGRSDKGQGGAGLIVLVIWLVLVILAPILGRLLALAVSRSREYDADATGAELTRNPLALASALRKIDQAAEPTRSIGRGAAHLCIADPLGRNVNQAEGSWGNFWGTHPPIRKRIEILEGMAGVVSAPSGPEAAIPGAADASASVRMGHG